jgi:CRP-like cAMP-binding protein
VTEPGVAVYQPVSTQNHILQQLPAEALARLKPSLSRIRLRRRDILQEINETVDTLTFIEHGLVALLARTQVDGLVGVGIVGHSGMVGISALLGTAHAPYRCEVEVEGEALCIGAAPMRRAMDDPAVRQPLMNHVQSLLVQNAQTALCNVRHDLVQRLARWLLTAHDRLDGSVIPLTHALLSTMLGVRRAGITAALSHLEDIGAIAKNRGAITVVNRSLLERRSCECYRVIADGCAGHIDFGGGTSGRTPHRTVFTPALEILDHTGA